MSEGQLEGSGVAPAIPSQFKSPFSQWLDMFRWLAAFSVVLSHGANRFLVRITDVASPHPGIPFYIFTFFAGFSHQAVMVFFVLSGYLVGGSLWKEAQRDQSVDTRSYLVKRISRLCIVLYPAFLMIALLNITGAYAFDGLKAGIYSPEMMDSLRSPTLACNVGFLQTALCEPYGGDGALWSLYNEFWYYILWFLFVVAWIGRVFWKRIAMALVAVALMILLTAYQNETARLAPYMLIWLLGVVVAAVARPLVKSSLIAGILFGVALLIGRLLIRRSFPDAHPAGMFFVDLALSGIFANYVVSLRFDKRLAPPVLGVWNNRLAAFSFSLYCVHMPLMHFYGAVVHFYTGTGWKMVPAELWSWAILCGSLVFCVASAYLFSTLTEAHTMLLRGLLMPSKRAGRNSKQRSNPQRSGLGAENPVHSEIR